MVTYCPHCATKVMDDDTACWKCNGTLTPVQLEDEPGAELFERAADEKTTRSSEVVGRYRDGYRVAATISVLGQTVKFAGLITALLLVVGLGVVISNSGASGDSKFGMSVVTFIVGGIIAFVFWVWGVIIAAVGQSLKASLDSAVHSSPFMDLREKARAMSMKIIIE